MEDKIQVLLVDDEIDFLETISFWFKSKGYLVIQANNGQEAIELIKSKHPDIVFLDVRMPGIDGLQTLARIREFDSATPVIMVTAHGDEKSLQKARQLGISGFFPKKADLIQLTHIIETTLRTHKKFHPPSPKTKQDSPDEQK